MSVLNKGNISDTEKLYQQLYQRYKFFLSVDFLKITFTTNRFNQYKYAEVYVMIPCKIHEQN